jgi:hypothetical protein
MLGVAYGAALGIPAGIALGGITLAVLWFALWRTAPVVRVGDDRSLSVGQARLPNWAIESISVAGAEEGRKHIRDHPATFTAFRPSVSPEALLISLADPADPHRYWLVSTRRATEFADALRS